MAPQGEEQRRPEGLQLGQAVGGTYIFVPEGEQNIRLYGYHITLVDNMEPTGTALDASMFLTFETAHDIARISLTMAEEPLEIPADSISAVMVRLEPGRDPDQTALDIMHEVPGVTPITSPNLFRAYRTQMSVKGSDSYRNSCRQEQILGPFYR